MTAGLEINGLILHNLGIPNCKRVSPKSLTFLDVKVRGLEEPFNNLRSEFSFICPKYIMSLCVPNEFKIFQKSGESTRIWRSCKPDSLTHEVESGPEKPAVYRCDFAQMSLKIQRFTSWGGH